MTDDPLGTGTTLEGLFTQVRIALRSQGQNTWPYPFGPFSHRLKMSPVPSGSKPPLPLHGLGPRTTQKALAVLLQTVTSALLLVLRWRGPLPALL